jgi:hypothetical protein
LIKIKNEKHERSRSIKIKIKEEKYSHKDVSAETGIYVFRNYL